MLDTPALASRLSANYVSNSVHLGLKIWSRKFKQNQHQNGEEK